MKILAILRWILVLPAAFIGGEAVTLFIRLLVQLGGDHSLIGLLAPFANAAFSTVGFFLAGIYVAPTRRYETATVLAAVCVLSIVGAMVFMPGAVDNGFAAMLIFFCFMIWKGYHSLHVAQRQKLSVNEIKA
jgi:hypothetical protein